MKAEARLTALRALVPELRALAEAGNNLKARMCDMTSSNYPHQHQLYVSTGYADAWKSARAVVAKLLREIEGEG